MHTPPTPIEIAACLDALQSMPDRLQAMVERCPSDRQLERPGDALFSLTEQVCHLRDIELEGYTLRIARVLAEEVPELQEIDGSTLAKTRRYQQQYLTLALDLFGRQRRANVALLRDHLAGNTQRLGIFGGFGGVTLWSLVQGMAAHDAEHLGEIEALGLCR
ncbi:MAG: DinB family protein [Burkholderiaceae bacterium]|nr:DinB family protein [Burkholderiaceae bacterium]